MHNKQIKIIDCFTPLIVYTLEFAEHSQDPIYTVDKLVDDYKTLIDQAQQRCDLKVSFDEALFPLTAWIDETILNSDLENRRGWRKSLLQKKFFDTSNAGEIFYKNFKHLSEDAFELRFLYLYILFLGFKGKYYRDEDAQKVEALFHTQKELLQDTFTESFPKYAFTKAYAQHQLPSKKRFKPSYAGLWVLIIVSLILALILFLASQAYLDGLLDKYNMF